MYSDIKHFLLGNTVIMAFSYKGAISFGLVYIPIALMPAVSENDIGFNMIEKNTMSRIKYQKTCVDCDGKEVKSENIVKGYQYEKDKYVIFTDEDFEKIKAPKDKNITIEEFVDLNEIDPIYFERAYYVIPTGGEKAYALLLAAMEHEGKAGIAKTVIGTKEAILCLRVRRGKMLANSLYFHDEVKKAPAVDIQKNDDKELKLAISLIKNMENKFTPEKYHDEYQLKLKQAIEEKIAGKEVTRSKEKDIETVANIMDALIKSVKLTQKKSANR